MIRIVTETNSIYEFDIPNKQMRRLPGSPATERVGDNEWKKYSEIGSISGGENVFTEGETALIIWGSDVAPLFGEFPDAPKMTITSFVTKIEDTGKSHESQVQS